MTTKKKLSPKEKKGRIKWAREFFFWGGEGVKIFVTSEEIFATSAEIDATGGNIPYLKDKIRYFKDYLYS